MNDKKRLCKLIQTYSFILYETVLYLDGHPDCKKALEHYRKYKEKLLIATKQYEEKYGPMTITGQECGDTWRWVKEPWPWEYEENDCSRNCGFCRN